MTDPFYAAEPDPTRPAAPPAPPRPSAPPSPADAPAPAPQPPSGGPPSAEEDFAFAGTEPPPAAARAPRERPERVHKLVFKGKAERERRHPVGPYEVDGREFDHLVVRRMTHGEVLDFSDQLAAQPEGTFRRFPMFHFPWGDPVPDDVWEQLDSDEVRELTGLMNDFLPSAYRAATSAGPTTPGTGPQASTRPDTTGSSSA